MPTHSESATFTREFANLTAVQQRQFFEALTKFIADLSAKEADPGAKFRQGLRIKPYRKQSGTFEMTWAGDGRALFEYGTSRAEGKIHVDWLRVGTHRIF